MACQAVNICVIYIICIYFGIETFCKLPRESSVHPRCNHGNHDSRRRNDSGSAGLPGPWLGSGWHNCENLYHQKKVPKDTKWVVQSLEISNQMPFHHMSDFEIGVNIQTAKLKILDFMENHKLNEFLKENFLDDLFNPHDMKHCHYFDEEEFDKLNRPSTSYLNIFSMNIRSLPKHGGELLHFMSILKANFDIHRPQKVYERFCLPRIWPLRCDYFNKSLSENSWK